MKIGLLLCDHVSIDHKHETKGDYDDIYASMLINAASNTQLNENLLIKSYYVLDDCFPDSPSECDSWIVTCSHHDCMSNLKWICKLKKFIIRIVESQKPLVGICFGHQLISLALGGKVARRKNWIAGVQTIKFKKNNILLKDSIKLLGIHRDEVVVPPLKAIVIGSTQYVSTAVISIPPSILTFQYHMELSANYLRALIESRKKMIGSKVYNKAKLSLREQLDSKPVSLVVLSFLANNLVLKQCR